MSDVELENSRILGEMKKLDLINMKLKEGPQLTDKVLQYNFKKL